MRRRLTIAIMVMVLATLAVSGLVSLVLVQRTTVQQTRRELVQEATGLATSVQEESSAQKDPAVALRRLLLALKGSLRLDGFAVVGVRPDGRLIGVAPVAVRPGLPPGLAPAALDPVALRSLRPVSGRSGSLVYAAVPYRAELQVAGAPRELVQAVVLTRRPPSALSAAGPWFGLSALVVLALAALVSWRLGQRFTAPVRAAQEVTSRIAAGDLEARVPAPPGTDPELAALAQSVNSMTAGLARAQAAERHFLQSVSHDLRTPLTSIRGFAEAIEDGAAGDAVAAAGVIAAEARRLERLVGDLLALATLEARRFTLQPRTVDLAEVTSVAVAGFALSARDMGLALEVRPSLPAYVTADPDRLGQVIANLVENALRHAGSRVEVGITPGGPAGAPTDGPGTSVWVTDDGPGIAPEERAVLFDRIYASRRRPDGAGPGRPIGSGLGLTIVSELVTAMGGTVRADSPVVSGRGTRLAVWLPAGGGHPEAGG